MQLFKHRCHSFHSLFNVIRCGQLLLLHPLVHSLPGYSGLCRGFPHTYLIYTGKDCSYQSIIDIFLFCLLLKRVFFGICFGSLFYIILPQNVRARHRDGIVIEHSGYQLHIITDIPPDTVVSELTRLFLDVFADPY